MFFLSPREQRHWSDRRILILVALGALIVTVIWHLPQEAEFLSKRTGELFLALTLSMAMVYVLRPLVRFFERYFGDSHKGKSWATLLTFALLLLACYLTFIVGFKPVQQDVSRLIHDYWPKDPQSRQALIQQWQNSINAALEPYRSFLPADVSANPAYLQEQFKPVLNGLSNWLTAQKAHIGFIVELLLIPVLAFYFLSEGREIRREARLFVPANWRAPLARMAHHLDFVLDGYVRGQAWMCVIAWVLTTVTLLILGVPHAITLGLIAGVTRAIPVIGPLLGAIPLVIICFISKGAQTTGFLAFAFLMMHFLESKVLLPKIVGHHVDLHPVSVILALLVGLEFFGFIGVFLAVPIAAVVKIMLVEYQTEQAQKLATNVANGAVAIANSDANSDADGAPEIEKIARE